jgi:hypothetical protein
MGKLKAAYAKVLGAPVKDVIYIDNTNCAVKADDVRFLFNGRRVKDEDTPQSRKMKDGDSINVSCEIVNAIFFRPMKLFYILLRFSKNKNYIYQQRNALKKR